MCIIYAYLMYDILGDNIQHNGSNRMFSKWRVSTPSSSHCSQGSGTLDVLALLQNA